MKNLKNLCLVALAAAMMSTGWLGATGLAMLGAFVPLLVVAGRHGASKRDFAKMAGWTALFIALWYGATVWWIWLATPAGTIGATAFAWVYCGGPFMLWFYTSKRAPKALSYTVLVSAWIVGEWIYNTSQASFPWLAVGNGFARDTWAVQWYEFTGAYGGTLWALVTSILIYEYLIVRGPRVAKNWLPPALAVVVPVAVSLAIYFTYTEPARTAKVTIVQPNIPAWEESDIPDAEKAANLAELTGRAPADARFIVMPETTIGETPVEGNLAASPSLVTIRQAAAHAPGATIVVGATTYKLYGERPAAPTPTARHNAAMGGWYDVYNSALAVSPTGRVDIHHKAKLVMGAEMMPTWWWVRGLQRMVADRGFYVGQYGFGTARTVFENEGAPEGAAMPEGGRDKIFAGAAICWESVYGGYFAEFVRGGAEVLFIITNDGWWRNTPGHRQHFDFARLRAIETRRAIARSANTGRSGFITPRGDVAGPTLEWEQRGVLTDDVSLDRHTTFFVRLGDWPCRLSMLVLGLGVLYFIAYRVRRKGLMIND